MRLQQALLGPLLVSFAFAQDLGVPLSWRKFSNSRPRSERITIAQNAINAIVPQLDSSNGEFNSIGYWQSGNVYSAAANQDKSAGTTTNRAFVINNLNLVYSKYAHYDKYGVCLSILRYGIRMFFERLFSITMTRCGGHNRRSMHTAPTINMLAHAVDVWTHVTGYVVTQAQANSGRNPLKTVTIQSTCNGKTMAGGVFWTTRADDGGINSITTGLYTTLSAFLAEYTGNSTYTNAAILSANWIKNHQINANNIVLDTTSADCSTGPGLYTYNSGKYIEGLSVLAAVTGDSSWTSLMINILNSAVKSSAWQGSDGIITEGSSPGGNNDGVGFKAIFIRGLHEAWTRNSPNTALLTLIHSYGDVQYNALLDLAATGNTYSSNWHGPPQAFTTWGQLAALDVMTSNIDTN
ncbi:Glycoside hydrolase family 76 protein [Mycena indigotica]|uniref:Glycoside hydrolase family 76 protein n=1 Tax=Mycena indigotica TaxID=2126181 RepID=A0A8H6T1Y3_9AGAR|nr:Glycoside hydrolase family 76 protein [Mycena indigotica]KAF7309360.1 Glycoside hydrolase family 76 protein [Mycena indigotica]